MGNLNLTDKKSCCEGDIWLLDYLESVLLIKSLICYSTRISNILIFPQLFLEFLSLRESITLTITSNIKSA